MLRQEAFESNIHTALEFVSNHDGIIAMGVRPTRPEPGYGYVQMGDVCELCDKHQMFTVKSFLEKPERDFAKIFMESGEFLWNTGIFVANARHLLAHCKQIMPELFRQLEIDGHANEQIDEEARLVWDYFPLFPNLSIDYGILEHADDTYVMQCDFGWADLGTWHSIYEAESRVEGDNVVLDSEVMLDNCHDSIIKLPKGRLGVFSGLDGFIVIENDIVLMVCKKEDSSAQIKKFVNEVQLKLGEGFI